MTEVESTVQYGGGRAQTPDSIDRELDWMINRDQQPSPQNTQTSDDVDRHSANSPRSPSPASKQSPDNYEQRDHHDYDDKSSPEPVAQSHTTTESPTKSTSPPPNSASEKSPSPTSSPATSPSRSPVTSPVTSPVPQTGDESSKDHFEMTDSQQKANAELDTMKLDLGYTEEDPPDYDVTERVRQLNEELANDPSPDSDRERSIKFKENLVDLVAPPPDIPTDDEGEDDQTETNNQKSSSAESSDDSAASPRDQPTSPEGADAKEKDKNDNDDEYGRDYSSESGDDMTPRSPRASKGDQSKGDQSPRSNDEKILVERNGKFEFLSAGELTAEERELYCAPTEDKEKSEGSHEPKPPSKPRPQTANGTSASRKTNQSSQNRSQSAQAYNTEWDENFTYQSPYAMTPEHRRELARKHHDEQKCEKEEKEKDKKEQEKKSQENNDAFEGWLRKKKDQMREENQQTRNENEEEDRDPEGAYDSWIKAKKEQSKKQRDGEKHRQKECDEGWYVRPREDCDKAFKEWLKKKHADHKTQKMDEKQKARIHKLLARRSRKSQQLARAIKQAQQYRYVDYYGYRF